MHRVGQEAELEQDQGGRRMASKAEKKLVQRSVKEHDALGTAKIEMAKEEWAR